MGSMLKASEYTDMLRSISIDGDVKRISASLGKCLGKLKVKAIQLLNSRT